MSYYYVSLYNSNSIKRLTNLSEKGWFVDNIMIKTDLTNKKESTLNKYQISDWKDIEGIFEGFDNELKDFGLELDYGNNADDNYWFRIIKRKNVIEINYYSSKDFPAIDEIIKEGGKKYKVICNSIRNVTTAKLVND